MLVGLVVVRKDRHGRFLRYLPMNLLEGSQPLHMGAPALGPVDPLLTGPITQGSEQTDDTVPVVGPRADRPSSPW